MQLQVCVKARTGRTWYAADSAVFPESMMLHEIDSEIDRLNLAYPELYFEALPYLPSRKIAPKQYRPWEQPKVVPTNGEIAKKIGWA